jgi:Tol biopolymer transport system component
MNKKKLIISLIIVSLFLTMVIPMTAAPKPPKPPKDPPADPAIVYRRADTVYVMNADGSNQADIWWPAGNPCWAPDGSAIAFGFENVLYRVDVTVVDGVPQGSNQIALTDQIKTSPPKWSPAGDEIAFINTLNGDYRLIQTVPATGGDVETIYMAPEGYSVSCFAWRNDASKMAIQQGGNGQRSIIVLDFSDSSTTTVFGPTTYWFGHIDWARTSDTLVCTSNAGISTIDLTDPSPTMETLIVGSGQYKMPSWSPDDSQIACLKWERNRWLNLMVYDLETEEMEKLAKGFAPDWCRA